VATYLDWQEPVRLLKLSTGPSTPAQHALAEQFGLTRQGDEPYSVLGVMLEEHLIPFIWDRDTVAEPASERQRNFLRSLEVASVADSPSLTKRVASAWIDQRLAVRTAKCLRNLQLKAGDT
jgi:hypothetical protein